ncbi:MAG: Sll0314/Alr1548 family TPR repeat-containing protein [Cyanobacteria bacterium P01_H01_bin.121]
MANPIYSQHNCPQAITKSAVMRRFRYSLSQRVWQGATLIALLLGGSATAVLAGDPFRTSSPQSIDATTEAAFRAMFEAGDYAQAAGYLAEAEESGAADPMAYGMLASLAYLNQDWGAIQNYANQTLTAAKNLESSSPLRSHLYQAIGHFLEGAYILSPAGSGTVAGVPAALGKLQQVYRELDRAEKIDATDPELNLVEGFMNLMIAVNLPLVSSDDAIAQLDQHAQPQHIAQRGIAVAYRDLKQYDAALAKVNAAIAANPSENPELYYLRAQIIVGQGLAAENLDLLNTAQADFRRALARSSQLPKESVAQIYREYCRNQTRLDNQGYDCGAGQREILATEGLWGPETLPDDLPGLALNTTER